MKCRRVFEEISKVDLLNDCVHNPELGVISRNCKWSNIDVSNIPVQVQI